MKGIQLGALWFSQNGLQCWDHVCHKRHPSSIFGALVFHVKKCFNVEDVFAVGGWGPVDFHKNGPPYGNHMQDQSSKLWISTSHSSQLDCFQMKPPKSLRWHPAKWKSPSWSTSIANPNMSEWWTHSKARERPRDHVWRLINALGCNSTNLMRFSSLCPTSRSIPLRLLPKEQRPLADPPWPGATSQAQKRCRTSGWNLTYAHRSNNVFRGGPGESNSWRTVNVFFYLTSPP